MASGLQFIENPTIVVVPRPKRGGRYRMEFAFAERAGCGHSSVQARLWLTFIEDGREARSELAETICSVCDPGRFTRVQSWARGLH